MKKVINFCGNCPFRYSHYEDFNLVDPITEYCTLSLFLNQEDNIIIKTTNFEVYDLITPDCCPLKKDDFEFTFKEFSNERLIEIDNVKKEIGEVIEKENIIVNNYEDFGYEADPEFIENNDRLKNLYNRLSFLLENEEDLYDSELEVNINVQIEEIQKQLGFLEKSSDKLNEFFNNIDNISFDDSDNNL